MHTRGSDEEQLNALFEAYRAACPDAEPGADFMPRLWQRIESRRSFSFLLGRMARGFVTAAVAATLAMAVYLYLPSPTTTYYSGTYVEVLAASGHGGDSPELFDAAYLDSETAGQL